ncbi:MAG: hypothetical protein EAX95_09010 [Candidatus Thorarchaeota archaeon]|nr:hypothetical protein [Candidatus Thorarchaeota archaeon]
MKLRNNLLDSLQSDQTRSNQIGDFAYRVFFLRVLSDLDLIPEKDVLQYASSVLDSQKPVSVLSRELGSLALFTNTPHDAMDGNNLPKDEIEDMAQSIANIRFKAPKHNWVIDSRIYLLCELFEAFNSRQTRKKRGSFYTPPWLAREITQLVVSMAVPETNASTDARGSDSQSITGLKVLDNACGCGVFLISAFDALLGEHAKEKGMSNPSLASTAKRIVRDCLFGSDIDPRAVEVADALLWTALTQVTGTRQSLNLIDNNLIVGDSLLQTRFANQFDIIVGNPPYFRLSRRDPDYRELLSKNYMITREYNAHALFLEASIRALRNGGLLGFLLHKNLLNLDTYRELRKHIAESLELCSLVDCGSGIFSQVTAETAVLILKRNISNLDTELKLMQCNAEIEGFEMISTIPLRQYLQVVENWNFRYILRLKKPHAEPLMQMALLPTLSEKVSISRGIETGDNTRFLSQTRNGPSWKPIIRGRDIQKFQLHDVTFIDYDRTLLAKSGRSDLLEIPKVVVRQNAMSPIAAFDPGSRLVLNSATYLANASPDFLKSLCVILNSTLVEWFFQLVLTNNSKVTVNILPNNLGIIPIPMAIDTAAFSNLYNLISSFRSDRKSMAGSEMRYSRLVNPVAEALVLNAYFPELVSSPVIEDVRNQLASPLVARALTKRIMNGDVLSKIRRIVRDAFSAGGFLSR